MRVEFVEGCVPVEEQVVVVINGRYMLDVVVHLGDVKHGFETQIEFHSWHCRRKFSFLERFIGFSCRTNGLTRCLSLVVRTGLAFISCCLLWL